MSIFNKVTNNVFYIHTRNRKTQHFEGIKKKATYFYLIYFSYVCYTKFMQPAQKPFNFLFYLKNYEILQLLDTALDPNVFYFPSLFLLSQIRKWIFPEPFPSAPQFADFIKAEQLCSGPWPGAQSLGKERDGEQSQKPQ